MVVTFPETALIISASSRVNVICKGLTNRRRSVLLTANCSLYRVSSVFIYKNGIYKLYFTVLIAEPLSATVARQSNRSCERSRHFSRTCCVVLDCNCTRCESRCKIVAIYFLCVCKKDKWFWLVS